ncbi:MAG: stage II sporulation protein M [Anaerolineales bacterium]|nr:stage II sporulation protein M [Anaerolineales bacterium]
MTSIAGGGARATSASWLVARRELRDFLRDWRLLGPILLLTIFFPWLMNLTARMAVNFVTRYGAPLVAERLIPFLLLVVGFFPISFCLVIALESFAGERERQSIEPLLAAPISNHDLYLGKMTAALVPPLAAAFLGIGVYLVGLWLQVGWVPTPSLLAQILLLTTAQAFVMVGAAVVISSQTTSVRAANLLASFIIIPAAQLIILESMVMFWGRYDVLWGIVLALVVCAVLLTRIGIHLFNREELLGREIDLLDLRWAGRVLRESFHAGARTPWSWYRGLFSHSLPKLKVPAVVVALAMGFAFLIGVRLASTFTLPLGALPFGQAPEGAVFDMKSFGLFTGQGWAWVFTNNVRAILIASFLGAFTFGVAGIVLLMAPIGIIGYFAGNLAIAGLNAPILIGGLVAPHGLAEIPAVILAGAAILRLGLAWVSLPQGTSLGESWLRAVSEWARVGLGLVLPLLAIAAALEVFVTPLVAIRVLTGS